MGREVYFKTYMHNLVSVIITTKNSAHTLPLLLESVKAQTYKNVEIIVVDNNSTDETQSIAKKYTTKVFNKGPERSAQRNFGAQCAKGEYLFILDSDMEATPGVIEDSVETAQRTGLSALVVPEKTVGEGWLVRVRQFEREMYMGDMSIEVARFFKKNVFFEFDGYDLQLTGPEDYDLPYRISKKYKIGRAHEYLLHHEEGTTLSKLLARKYYYGSQGALYAQKHPELVGVQGNLLFRKAYLKNWLKFVQHPFLGITFLLVRLLETIWAIAGFISAVGVGGFMRTAFSSFPR